MKTATKPFWKLNLNPIDMMRPPEVIKAKERKVYYNKNKELFKIKYLSKKS